MPPSTGRAPAGLFAADSRAASATASAVSAAATASWRTVERDPGEVTGLLGTACRLLGGAHGPDALVAGGGQRGGAVGEPGGLGVGRGPGESGGVGVVGDGGGIAGDGGVEFGGDPGGVFGLGAGAAGGGARRSRSAVACRAVCSQVRTRRSRSASCSTAW